MISPASHLDENRLFSTEPAQRTIARDLYESIRGLPIVSPHGHTDPAWFAADTAFLDPATLLVIPDHYLFRMLHSQGVSHDSLGIPRRENARQPEPREIWRTLASHYDRFAGTPTRLWVDHSLADVLECSEPLTPLSADRLFDHISAQLAKPAFRPRALLDKLRIEVIATTDGALDPLKHHERLAADGLGQRVRTTYRPDSVTDPEAPDFALNLRQLGEMTGTDTGRWHDMIEAHRRRRIFFRALGATATDHGVPSALTANLSQDQKQSLLDRALAEGLNAEEAGLFRGQMLTEMAKLSIEDGMVMQIHAGVKRNTDQWLFQERGANMGADIPLRTDFVNGLQPLLDACGNAEGLRIILFTVDETTYARELAPMTGHWPCLTIGPPWWFHDSPFGIRRYFDQVIENAGFFNVAGFNDDTRALLSIPARHDVWRRECCRFLATLVGEHRVSQADAAVLAKHLAYDAAKIAYRL